MVDVPPNSTASDGGTYSNGFVIGTMLCLSTAATVGFIGNALLVIIISKTRKLRSVMNRFILHLAVGDLIVCLICIPLFLAINFYFKKNSHEWICKISRFLQYLAPQASMMLLITIGMNRHQAIVHPLQGMTYSRANKLIVGAWLYSVIMVSPSLYLTRVQYYFDHASNKTEPYCATIPVATRAGLIYVLALALLGYVIPLTILVVLYTKISLVVFRRGKGNAVDLRISRPNGAMLRSRKKVIKMFLTVILVFVVTWVPLILYIGILERYLHSTTQRISHVRLVLYAIGLSNSTYNPFIYSFFNKRFREGCKGLFKSSVHIIKKPARTREVYKERQIDSRNDRNNPQNNVDKRDRENNVQNMFSDKAVREHNAENAIETRDYIKLLQLRCTATGDIVLDPADLNNGLERNEGLETRDRTSELRETTLEFPTEKDDFDTTSTTTMDHFTELESTSGATAKTTVRKPNKLFRAVSIGASPSQNPKQGSQFAKQRLRKAVSDAPERADRERQWINDFENIF